MTAYIGYCRVSTAKQGRSGLGLEAQEAAINGYLNPGDKLLSPLYVEVESGKRSDRPELDKALNHAKLTGATLLVAKLDRLARDVFFIAQLMKSGVDFVALDMPHANRFTIHILAAVAEHEAELISQRTKAALRAAKERGQTLGGFRGVKVDPSLGRVAKQGKAREFNQRVQGVIAELQAQGHSGLSELARQLNAKGIRTSRGGEWSAVQVGRVLAQYAVSATC